MNSLAPLALAATLPLVLLSGCGSSNSPAKSPDEVTAKAGDGGAGATDAEPEGGSQASVCTGSDLDLLNTLLQGACEVPNAPSDAKRRDVSALLDVKVTVSPNTVPRGGHADVVVTFTNKSSELLPLDFTLDPTPRFSVEVYTASNKRAEMPSAHQPPGRNDDSATPTTARVMLYAGGKASAKVDWNAVKLQWAPELLKGTPPELGFPTKPAGPLPKGKYVLKVVTPLTGVFEGMDHEVSTAKVPVIVQ
jgi:hypothetical protein